MTIRTRQAAGEADVESYKHKEAKRKNIPTAENQKLIADDDKAIKKTALAAQYRSRSAAALLTQHRHDQPLEGGIIGHPSKRSNSFV